MNDEINDPIAMLRSELASVAPSAEFAASVRSRLTDDLEPLRAELADLTPSSAFAARVRQGIEQEGSRGLSWSRFTWRWIVPATGIAAATIAAVTLWPRQAPERTRPASPVNEVARVQPAAPRAVTSSTPHVASSAPRTLSREPRVQSARSAVEATPRDPMLEVITDQPALLRDLWVRVAPGVAVDSTEPAGTYVAPKLEIPPIEVSPITMFLVPDSRTPMGITPFILRIAAEQAERSFR